MTIKEMVFSLAETGFNLSFQEYLAENRGDLIICRIDQAGKTIQVYEQPKTNFDSTSLPYIESQAGYLVADKEKNTFYDILLISDKVLGSSTCELETIIIHELAHWLIDSGNAGKLKISKEAMKLGKNIPTLLHPDDKFHNVEFCQVLAEACIAYNKKGQKFDSSMEAIRSAMRFDIYDE